MEEFGAISDLIVALYDAASGATPFAPLAGQIAKAFDCQSCAIQIRNGFVNSRERLTYTPNYTPEAVELYNSYYYQHDIWTILALRRPMGETVSSDTLISDAEFRETIIYREYSRAIGLFYMVGGLVPVGGPNKTYGIIGIHRTEQEGLFSPEEKRRVALLLPHVRRSLQLRERLGQMNIQQQAMFRAIETVSLGVLLVLEDGRILFANGAAEDILRQGAGLLDVAGRICAFSPALDTELQRDLKSAARASQGRAPVTGGMLRLPRGEASPLILSIYPMVAPHLAGSGTVGAALIFISDPDQQPVPDRETLTRVYGLTGAEARLFEALVAGERLQDYAERSVLSLQTVKTQLGRLFSKTGTSRQTDLIREALSNPVLSLRKR